MTQTASATRIPSAPELQMLLLSNRYGGSAASHGRSNADRAARRMVTTTGLIAGLIWTFDLWLVVRPGGL